MTRSVSEIRKEIQALGAEDKEALLRDLILDLEESLDEDIERAWIEEAHRRLKQLDDGSIEPIPAEEVFKRVRAQLTE